MYNLITTLTKLQLLQGPLSSFIKLGGPESLTHSSHSQLPGKALQPAGWPVFDSESHQ